MEIASGWLGWPEDVSLRTDVNYIAAAYEGRLNMLKAIFGSGEDKKPPSAVEIRNFARTHNALFRAGRIRNH